MMIKMVPKWRPNTPKCLQNEIPDQQTSLKPILNYVNLWMQIWLENVHIFKPFEDSNPADPSNPAKPCRMKVTNLLVSRGPAAGAKP